MTKSNAMRGFLLLSSMVPLPAESGLYAIKMDDIDGNPTNPGTYSGKVLLIVNVASKCGFTYQYKALEDLYQRYQGDGLAVLGFPSNDFLRQEPGTNEDIKQFCERTYGVTFPMFSKITVKGRQMHPLYRYLTSKKTDPKFSGRVTWNFNKFLVSRSGEIINRFGSPAEPDAPEVIGAIEEALAAAR